MLVAHEFAEQSMRLPKPFQYPNILETQTEWKRIDEGPHDPFCTWSRLHASEEESAEDDIIIAGSFCQNNRPGKMTDTSDAYARFARLLF
jgi:hypothetical protein